MSDGSNEITALWRRPLGGLLLHLLVGGAGTYFILANAESTSPGVVRRMEIVAGALGGAVLWLMRGWPEDGRFPVLLRWSVAGAAVGLFTVFVDLYGGGISARSLISAAVVGSALGLSAASWELQHRSAQGRPVPVSAADTQRMWVLIASVAAATLATILLA